jgi:CSLREA domain-containing protein
MTNRTKHTRSLVRVAMLLLVLTGWFTAPRLFRHWVEPAALAAPMTFVVNTAADADDGLCSPAPSGCTLREAIKAANTNPGTDTINFNIPGAGVKTITLVSALPFITDPVIIDGYSQGIATPNTFLNGDNAVLLIELNGVNTICCADPGLNIGAGGSTVRGLVINRFQGPGIRLSTGNNIVAGNFIGTDAAGAAALGNALDGITISSSSGNIIGGTAPADRNIVSGNQDNGIQIGGNSSTGNLVQGNLIGTGRNTGVPLSNKHNGVFLIGTTTTNNTIGGDPLSAGNVIAFNGNAGVLVNFNTNGNAILENSIYSNDRLGIDLFPNGVTPNDAADADTGANKLQNFPVLTKALDVAGITTIQGTFNSRANDQFRIEFFSSPSCDDSGNGEGKKFVGFTNVTTDASGNSPLISFDIASASLDGPYLTATATDSANNTSEFSNCVSALSTFFSTVNSTADTDDGSCTSAVGGCTLREAINVANANPDANAIKFDIPGSGVRTITLLSALPTITGPVVIDGYTQTGSSPNTLADGDNAVRLIELSGASAGNTDGLVLKGGSSIVRGLVINGFQLNGIKMDTKGDNVIAGNFIGTNVAGNTAVSNKQAGVFVGAGAHDDVIGGTAASARNLISGNLTDGIIISFSPNNRVLGNYIGTDSSGNAKLGNSLDGVLISGSSNFNLVGGAADGARNLISGNKGSGVQIVAGSPGNNKVQGNFIGTKANGVDALGNSGAGVQMNSANTTIGGDFFLDEGNSIAFNTGGGVFVGSGTGNRILGNSIYSNDGNIPALGIDLFPSGVTSNDAGDSDSGANNLQNFPVLTSATTANGETTFQGSLDSTPNTSFHIEFFSNASCDPSGNGEGHKFINSMNVTTNIVGSVSIAFGAPTSAFSGPFITATATDSAGNTSEFSKCIEAPPASTFQFGTPSMSVVENCDEAIFTVSRVGDTTTAASVDYATQSGTASDRTDFTVARGTLNFAPGETGKSVSVLITEDSFIEGAETATLTLSNNLGAGLGNPSTATLTISDDSPESSVNPTDVAEQFVCQQYHDFLNRQHDAAGLNFWTNNIEQCGSNATCVAAMRVNVSAAFFLSIEFQETGGNVIRSQRAAFGKKSDTAAVRISYNQFIKEARQVGDSVVVGDFGWEQKLQQNKQAYAEQVVTSPAFVTKYPLSLAAADYVNALYATAMVTPTDAEKQDGIAVFGAGGTTGRVAAFRRVADSDSLRTAEFRPAFVLLQYFGFLRRNPTDAPDVDDSGYQFWLAKLNQFNGDFAKAEMVKAFIVSTEYRSRFGQP